MFFMHTPRLCIDGRAAKEFAFEGIPAQELIDQLVATAGEGEGEALTCDWVDKSRTVLLSHPEQVFTGQLRRFNTRWKMGKSPLDWWWERQFLKNANVSAFHRFRPADRLSPHPQLPTLTTVLPARGESKAWIRSNSADRFVVPSLKDGKRLAQTYRIAEEQIRAIQPSVRRYVHFVQGPKTTVLSTVLFLADAHVGTLEKKRLVSVIANRFPNLRVRVVSLQRKADFSPTEWVKLLSGVRLLVYATARPFDWGTLALESIFWGIPTLFSDEHAALNELLPNSPLSLNRYLIENSDASYLSASLEKEQQRLAAAGAFDPGAAARAYRPLYSQM